MAKICPECAKKPLDTSVRGSCQAASRISAGTTLPKDHLPWTDSPNLTLCEACAEQFQLCARCWGPLEGGRGITVPTEKQFCVQFDDDNGSHVTGMYVGEQILARMVINIFSGITWDVKATSNGVRLATARFVNAGNGFGWLELYFDLNKADPEAVIELKKVSMYPQWINVPKNSPGWRITVEVKQ